ALTYKHIDTNPCNGPFHFWVTVQGLLPHKIEYDQATLEHLKVSD
ncbi:hypothetical protein DBR06_SOUSAS6310024, partial [Sousa chinensis]